MWRRSALRRRSKKYTAMYFRETLDKKNKWDIINRSQTVFSIIKEQAIDEKTLFPDEYKWQAGYSPGGCKRLLLVCLGLWVLSGCVPPGGGLLGLFNGRGQRPEFCGGYRLGILLGHGQRQDGLPSQGAYHRANWRFADVCPDTAGAGRVPRLAGSADVLYSRSMLFPLVHVAICRESLGA